VNPADLIATARRDLARLPPVLSALLDGLDPALWTERPAANEWSAVEIVCHLRDEETEDFGARVRVVLAGGDRFVPIDPERWARERGYREQSPEAALAALRGRRAESLAFLATVAAAGLDRVVDQPGFGRMSGLDLLAAWVTHDRLHVAQLVSTLARVGADRWAPLRTEYAGPIPYGSP
jgi:hypothetical protein